MSQQQKQPLNKQPPPSPASAPSSSYDVFSAVDKMVAKPVMGSDGAAAWQNFRSNTTTTKTGSSSATGLMNRPSVAPVAPLKKVDRLAFSSWKEEQNQERQVRKQAGDADLHGGYTTFQEKGSQAEDAAQRKEKKRIEARRIPDDKPYFQAAQTFQGWKFDYVFTTKDRGTGYYWDGMDGLKKLRGELKEEDTPESSSTTPTETTQPVPDQETRQEDGDAGPKKGKKRKKSSGPVIVDDPDNPLEQIAAAIHRARHGSTALSAEEPSTSMLLPEGWEAAIDSMTQKTYYFCRATGERKWEKPAAVLLPPGWNAVKDPSSGKEYYYNAETRETRWDRPV